MTIHIFRGQFKQKNCRRDDLLSVVKIASSNTPNFRENTMQNLVKIANFRKLEFGNFYILFSAKTMTLEKLCGLIGLNFNLRSWSQAA